MNAPYVCKYCGMPSWHDPVDQCPPIDYCHESDHGEPDDENQLVIDIILDPSVYEDDCPF